jgi:hypothetical protein
MGDPKHEDKPNPGFTDQEKKREKEAGRAESLRQGSRVQPGAREETGPAVRSKPYTRRADARYHR